jgi:hypothetical protein
MTTRLWPAYFAVVTTVLLVLSLVAFSDNLFFDVGQPSNRDPKFIVHGLFGLAWYVLLALQANLVRMRNVRLHRRLGVTTFLVGVGVTLSTLWVFVAVWKGWAHMSAEARANRTLLPGFALALLLAWRWRTRSDWHKRLILAGTFLMLGPVLARCYDPLIVSWLEPLAPAFAARVDEVGFLIFFVGLWIGAFASLARYDWITLRRVHPVTLAGIAWLLVAWAVAVASPTIPRQVLGMP